MFSESRNDRRHRIGDRTAADRLKDRDNAAGIGDSSAEISDDAAGIVDIAANMIPNQTPSLMETGVTLFLEDKFQRGGNGELLVAVNPLWKKNSLQVNMFR